MSGSEEPIAEETEVDLVDQIEANAKGPSSASVDGQSASQHPLKDQIAADRYVRRRNTAKANEIRISKTTPPGTV